MRKAQTETLDRWPKKGGMQRKGIDLPISPHNVVLLVLYTLFGRRGSTYA